MKKILFIAAITALVSCDSSEKEEKYVFKDSTGLTPATQTPVTVDNTTNNPNLPVNPNLPGNATNFSTSQPQTVITQQPTTPTTATAPGMNPPHGQPGHRCDIPVGAPLNSKPTTQPVVTTQQPSQTVITQQPTTPTAPGMNPPHGQPNHRCDIAVGAPLNSKPAAKPGVTDQTTPTTITIPSTIVPAVKKDSGQ